MQLSIFAVPFRQKRACCPSRGDSLFILTPSLYKVKRFFELFKIFFQSFSTLFFPRTEREREGDERPPLLILNIYYMHIFIRPSACKAARTEKYDTNAIRPSLCFSPLACAYLGAAVPPSAVTRRDRQCRRALRFPWRWRNGRNNRRLRRSYRAESQNGWCRYLY